jgi:hypothetical protein
VARVITTGRPGGPANPATSPPSGMVSTRWVVRPTFTDRSRSLPWLPRPGRSCADPAKDWRTVDGAHRLRLPPPASIDAVLFSMAGPVPGTDLGASRPFALFRCLLADLPLRLRRAAVARFLKRPPSRSRWSEANDLVSAGPSAQVWPATAAGCGPVIGADLAGAVFTGLLPRPLGWLRVERDVSPHLSALRPYAAQLPGQVNGKRSEAEKV